jgi:hypothetical protein
MIVEITPEQLETCKKFANKVVDTNIDMYKRRNQFDRDKIIDDIIVGKIGEFAVCNMIVTHKKLECTLPDVMIYGRGGKSFDADLSAWHDKGDKSWYFHVKTMKKEAAERWGLSWSFQVEDPLVTDPEAFNQHYLALCELIDYTTVDIKTVVKSSEISLCWSDPKLNKLKGIKKVLYWETLEPLPGVKKL